MEELVEEDLVGEDLVLAKSQHPVDTGSSPMAGRTRASGKVAKVVSSALKMNPLSPSCKGSKKVSSQSRAAGRPAKVKSGHHFELEHAPGWGVNPEEYFTPAAALRKSHGN